MNSGITLRSPEKGHRLRLIIETDAGGDPDDEQSLVRFLLYANEWDIEGIIANRPKARDGENLNPERTGLGIVLRLVAAYGKCHPHLARHDSRYPSEAFLRQRTVAGYDETDAAVHLIMAALNSSDPRPLWYCDWGSDHGSASNNLKRTLDRILKEQGPERYARIKRKLRILCSGNLFGDHTAEIEPPFPVLIDPFQPERWYHRFSALTSTAGGFDIGRDLLTGHGPLGALYPTNTTHPQKEGDSLTFLYLVPTGMNDPEQPTWGSWAGRFGPSEQENGWALFCPNLEDIWQGVTNRDNTLARWAAHLQNDFKARLDWCVSDISGANHPPVSGSMRPSQRTAASGETVTLDATGFTDPDGDDLIFEWIYYPEPGTYLGPAPEIRSARSAQGSFVAPPVDAPRSLHFILIATDSGTPPLTRYQRVIVTVRPKS